MSKKGYKVEVQKLPQTPGALFVLLRIGNKPVCHYNLRVGWGNQEVLNFVNLWCRNYGLGSQDERRFTDQILSEASKPP